MSCSEGSGSSSGSGSPALGDLLAFFAAVADYAAGAPAADGERIAALATAIGELEQLTPQGNAALYYAARLRNAGAIGNAAFVKGNDLSERARRLALDDIPARGARVCERIAALPAGTADIVRWRAENWDGTGHPDQLRWSGIPKSAQILHIAADFVQAADPEEALGTITSQAGQTYAPEQTRSFVMWFHTSDAQIAPMPAPPRALSDDGAQMQAIFDTLALLVDEHNATPGRSARIAGRVASVLEELHAPAEEIACGRLAAQLAAIGELRADRMEDEQFDPLARLGLELRVAHATQSAQLMACCPGLADVQRVLRARSEWFDGTGGPDGLRSREIPRAAQAIAVATAYDRLEQMQTLHVAHDRTLPVTRLETASGTQFDPAVVRALSQAIKSVA